MIRKICAHAKRRKIVKKIVMEKQIIITETDDRARFPIFSTRRFQIFQFFFSI